MEEGVKPCLLYGVEGTSDVGIQRLMYPVADMAHEAVSRAEILGSVITAPRTVIGTGSSPRARAMASPGAKVVRTLCKKKNARAEKT